MKYQKVFNRGWNSPNGITTNNREEIKTMLLPKWNIINADNKIIKQVFAKDKKSASKKIKFLYGNQSVFLKIEKA